MSNIAVNGINLYYELHGPEDGAVIVLSNGILMSTASWAFQIPDLSKKYRVLLYDCRGMWRSDHPAGPYTMEMHADDLHSLLSQLNIHSAHIGGISYGAEVSMQFAIQYPEMTKTLIVSSAVSHLDPLLKGFGGGWVMAAKTHDPELLLQVTYPLNFSERWIQANYPVIEQTAKRYEVLDFDSFLSLMNCFMKLNLTEKLKEINAPTLVMVGEEDILKPRKYAEMIANRISNAELYVVPGAGHALCLEKYQEFNSLILGFLERNSGE